MTFYAVISIISVVALTADMILRYMEKIRSFGMEQRIHNIKGKTIPIEDFIPHNITMVCVFALTAGVIGILLKLIELSGFIVFPISVFCGALMNFFIMHFIYPLFYVHKIPEDEDLSECEAVCTESMDAENYGSVEVTRGGEKYSFPAYPANENTIMKGDKVAVLYREDGVCLVEKLERITEILNEKQEL